MMRIATIIIFMLCLGCSNSEPVPKTTPSPVPTPNTSEWKLVDCSECDGKGEVVYDEDHFMVINNFAEPGTYTCPMCRGLGELAEEQR